MNKLITVYDEETKEYTTISIEELKEIINPPRRYFHGK